MFGLSFMLYLMARIEFQIFKLKKPENPYIVIYIYIYSMIMHVYSPALVNNNEMPLF